VSELRIGTGVDAHALEPGVPLVLGGIAFDSPRGLAGHSDGDVITHALIDALLGAAALGDIGGMFPPDDPELKGVSSVKLLREAYAQVRRAGYELVNADVVFIGQQPRVAPVARTMQGLLAGALDLADASRITVRATTTDGLGFTGRGEGLAAQAVALLARTT
jgi:2-C-methyl-D-erythritol 2,4-cyclodiphosphate synthase